MNTEPSAIQKKRMHPLALGVITGLFLQLAVGPVFFFVLGIALTSSFSNSLSAILAVTLADYLYITLSLIGIGSFTDRPHWKRLLAATSTLVLILFGIFLCYKGIALLSRPELNVSSFWTPLRSFTGAFILTVSSPLTMVFWTGIFSAKAIEHNYRKRQLIWFGCGAGFATLIFLSTAMFALSLSKAHIPSSVWQVTNCLVGLALIYYGISRAFVFSRLSKKQCSHT